MRAKKRYYVFWGVIFVLIGAAAQYAFGEGPDTYWYVSDIANNYEIRKVPVYYVDVITECEHIDPNHTSRGCFIKGPQTEAIFIVTEKEFDWANQGCTVHDHEYYHAMGFKHGVGPLSSTCPMPVLFNPEYGGDDMQDFKNATQKIVYPDPLYNYKFEFKFDPRNYSWYIE